MTINKQEPTILAATFHGLNRGTDPRDLPFGQFVVCRNLLTDSRNGTMETRPGYMPVTDRLFETPFAILPGAAGGRTLTIPEIRETPPFGDFALKLVATPNRDVHEGDTVTFAVYGGADLGIATYSWDFSYNGTPNADTTGASTSVTHEYSAAGSYTVLVWGTGSDSKVYRSSLLLTVLEEGETDTPPAAVPSPPPELGGGNELDDEEPPEITVTPATVTIAAGGSVQIQYKTKRAQTVYMVSPDATKTELANVEGHVTVTPAASGTYVFIAENSELETAQDNCEVTVGTPEVPVPEYLVIECALPTVDVDGVIRRYVGSAEEFDLTVTCYGRDENDQIVQVPFPAAPTLTAFDKAPASTTDNIDSVEATVADNVYTFADLTMTLAESIASGTVKLRATVADTALKSQRSILLYVRVPEVVINVDVVDEFGNDIVTVDGPYTPPTEGGDGSLAYDFCLLLSAKDPDTGGAMTDYAGDVLLWCENTGGWPTDPTYMATPAASTSPFDDATADEKMELETLDVGGMRYFVVPGSLFANGDAGFVTVWVTAYIRATEDYALEHFCDLEFKARERLYL